MSGSVVVTETPIEVTISETTEDVTVVESTNAVTVATVGVQGAKGDTGATGATGAKGDTGDTGATGAGVATGGTAGQVLVKNSSTNYDTGWATPAMVLIKSQAITNGVSSVVVSNVFSSTYRNYLIVIDRASSVNQVNATLTMQLGSVVTGYYGGGRSTSFTGSTFSNAQSNASAWFIGYAEQVPWGGQQINSITLSAPNLPVRTSFTASSFGGEYHTVLGGTNLNETAQTSFTISISNTFNGGQIVVYGYTF